MAWRECHPKVPCKFYACDTLSSIWSPGYRILAEDGIFVETRECPPLMELGVDDFVEEAHVYIFGHCLIDFAPQRDMLA